jgi:hypothetical protein
VEEEVGGVGVGDGGEVLLVLAVADAQHLIDVPAEHPQPEEGQVALPVLGGLAELRLRPREAAAHFLGPALGPLLVLGDVQLRESGDALGHEEVHLQGVHPGEFPIRPPHQFLPASHVTPALLGRSWGRETSWRGNSGLDS